MVVGAMDAESFFKLLPEEQRPRHLRAQIEAIKPRYWRYSFTVKVPDYIVPEGLAQHACYHDLNKPLLGEHFLQIFTLPNRIYGGMQNNQRSIMVRMLLPYEQSSLSPKYIAQRTQAALQNIESFIPFLSTEQISVSPDPKAIEQDAVFSKYYAFSKVEDIPAAMRVYEMDLDHSGELGISADWAAHGLPGVALCSRDTYPQYGLLGEILSARTLLPQMIKFKKELKG
jgi:hypothetical protein